MDRHEYEINQLINPKKDIVKSNSKHRDKIETLIQGRRIGGIVEGGEPPKKILKDGKYKYGITYGAEEFFIACTIESGHVYVYAESLDGEDNINIYRPSGEFVSNNVSDELMQTIRDICEKYDNFVDVTKEVQPGQQIANFNTYIEL